MASVFTMIINGDIPGHFIYRDDTCVAFLSIEPLSPGQECAPPPVWRRVPDRAEQRAIRWGVVRAGADSERGLERELMTGLDPAAVVLKRCALARALRMDPQPACQV